MTSSDIYSALLFFFSALGVLNGVLLVVFARAWFTSRVASVLFGLLFLALTVRIGKTVAMYFLPDLAFWIIQLGLTACTFIGPLLYLFVLNERAGKIRAVHFLHVAAPLVVMSVVGLVFPFSQHPEMWKQAHKVIYHYWLIYLLLSCLEVNKVLPVSKWRHAAFGQPNVLLVHVLIANILVWISYYTFKYTSVIAGAVTFSAVTYMLILFAFHGYLKQSTKGNKKIDSVPDSNKLPDVDLEVFRAKIDLMMLKDKQYKDANITLPKAAKLLNTTPHRLSYYLNNVAGTKFADWLNEYRINEAKQLLTATKRTTIDNVAESCGYNSTSKFYSEFKKSTGMTPASYRKANGQTL